jgi:hypothetical protein
MDEDAKAVARIMVPSKHSDVTNSFVRHIPNLTGESKKDSGTLCRTET